MLDAQRPCGRILKKGYIDPWFTSEYQATAPFVFLKVCGHWRAVARSTPLLWSTLNISNYRFDKGTCHPLPLNALVHWLSLSELAPLNLYLTSPHGDNGPELPLGHTEQILQLLARDGHRWQSLSVFIDARMCQALEDIILHQLAQDAFPNFHRLELDTTAARETFDWSTLAQAVSCINSLKELYLVGECLRSPDYALRGVQWGHLITIFLDVPVTVDEAAFYLAHSTTAETVTFNFLLWTDPNVPYPQYTTLPCLKSLTLFGSDESHRLLDVFDFPSLENLSIRITMPRSPLPHALSLNDLMERSRCPLKNLLIVLCCTLSPSDAAEYLLNPQLHNVPQVVLACDYIRGEVEDIARTFKKGVPPIWAWEVKAKGTQNMGWKQEFDKRLDKGARIINSDS